MDSKQSPIQLLLSQNRFKFVTLLSYPKIASFLISNSILSENQHVKIKNGSTDSAGRMDDLVSLLYQLNSIDAFNHFRNAIIACGHLDLAESLNIDHQKTCQLDHVLNPEILSKVFGYLMKSELLTARLVCNTWNDVICTACRWSPTIRLKNQNDLNHYVTANTKFCTLVTDFRLSGKTFSDAERCLWTNFFKRFGNNIESLELTELNVGVVELIFSEDIQKYFTKLIRLWINVSLKSSFVANTSLSFLAKLKHLTVEATGEISEYGQMEFLSKLCKVDHKLESLALLRHFCVGGIPSGIIRNLFRTNTITSIEIGSQPGHFLNHSDFKAMTIKTSSSSGLQSIKFVKMSSLPEQIIIHQFLLSHRRTLKRITISSCGFHLTDLPQLDVLTHLSGDIRIQSDALSFCTQFPNLEVLELKLVLAQELHVRLFEKFRHNALRSFGLTLQLERNNKKLTDDETVAWKSFISSCCPNLKKFAINYV